MPIKVYMTNISSNKLTIGNQRQVQHILHTNKIDHVDVDISEPNNSDEKLFLQRTLAAMQKPMSLPQIFHDDQFCCDFDGLLSAVESNTLKQVLKLDNETIQPEQVQ